MDDGVLADQLRHRIGRAVVGLQLAHPTQVRGPLPGHEAVHAVFQEALSGGFGEGDYSALANWIRRRS